jgi:DNA repair exonuclease SbcCD nuclease subunit
MKIALVTDTHWGVRNDNLSFLDYFDKFYSKVFFPEVERRCIRTILHLGDIVDRRKYISYVTLRRLKQGFIEPCIERGIDLHVIVGNHDVPYKSTNEINAMQELFDKAGINYYSTPKQVDFGDGIAHAIVPWINNQNYADSMQFMELTDAQVVFGHFEIAGCLMDRGNINDHGLKISDFKRFDKVMSGHFHHKSTTQNIEYLGCPYELTWADYQDPKGFHIYDTETRELEFIRNPYSMFNKVFYNDEGKTLDELLDTDFSDYEGTFVKVVKHSSGNPYWFDKFMDKLLKAEPINVQVVDDHLNLDLEDEDDIVNEAEDTVTILSKFIEQMPDNVPKKQLDNLMRSLYTEALHFEV